ncbi:hypothetical protein GH5_00905 [Leishmania sp. Ghana 2012 LV757]|uniref:hypothetical protein n=1 Tax=Leishmania sp. Ghana 2012 LV757 TaxID=2803181 RepID=UPI001B510DDA|nr:hypothetical protein GH5_00905 [Leishmania sp. Ghana 2012 LV757]
MADSHPPSAASPASSSCTVYRLKHNPSWTKFGMNRRMRADTNARPSQLSSGLASAHRASAAHSAVSSANASFRSTASARQPASMRGLAFVGAQAALRHEHYQQMHAASRLTDRRSPASHASDLRRAPHPTMSGSAFEALRARGDGEVKACSPESAPRSRAASRREEEPMTATPMSTTSKNKSGSCDHGSEMPCTSGDANSFTFTASCKAEATWDPRLQSSVLSLLTASSSRAKDSHLKGSAALVAVPGPLDALYVPLRRLAPRGCAAARQNFSIFEGTHCMGAFDRSESRAGTATGSYREARIDRRGIVGGSPETDTYRTTSSAYGLGR